MNPYHPAHPGNGRCPGCEHRGLIRGERSLPVVPGGFGDENSAETLSRCRLEVGVVGDVAQGHLGTPLPEPQPFVGVADENPNLTGRADYCVDNPRPDWSVGSYNNHRHLVCDDSEWCVE